MKKILVAVVGLVAVGCGGTHTDPTMNQMNPNQMGLNYPSGPFGYAQGSVIQNIQFSGKIDPAGAAGTNPYTSLPMQPISLAQYYNDPSVKFLYLSGVARWCAPCNDEQNEVSAAQTKYEPKGVRFLEAVIEGGTRGVPATETDIDLWQAVHQLHVGIAIDPTDAIHQYADIAAFPLNMIVRTSDMQIVYMATGELPPPNGLDDTLAQFVQ